MRSPHRRLALVLTLCFALLGSACAADGELGGPALGGTLAASIGSYSYTNADLEAEVEAWMVNPAFLQLLTDTQDFGQPGRRSMVVTNFVLNQRIAFEQARQIAATVGVAPTDAEIDQTIQLLDENLQGLFQGYGDEFRRALAADVATQQALGNVDPSTFVLPEVAINPRYGTYESSANGSSAVPPAGPVQLSAVPAGL